MTWFGGWVYGENYSIIRSMRNFSKLFTTCILISRPVFQLMALTRPFSNTGVRQGDNRSPVLVVIFMNDLEDHLFLDQTEGIPVDVIVDDQTFYFLKIFVLLYADDTIIQRCILYISESY